jgi:DNA-binding NarL/FixJ family response regulator
VEASPTVHVVVLYRHPLLGEGLASLLSAEPGVTAEAVDRDDACGVADALKSQPELVVVEDSEALRSFDTAGSGSPSVFLTAIEGVGGNTLGQHLSDPEAVISLARGLTARAAAR